MESQLEESIKGHAALEERHEELEKANQDMAIEVKASMYVQSNSPNSHADNHFT